MARRKKPKNKNASRAAPDAAPRPAGKSVARSDVESFHNDVEEIKNLLLVRRTSEALDLVDLLRSKRRLMVTNFILGLFRGIGFFLGATFVGALILGLLALTFGWFERVLGLEEGTTRSYVQEMVGRGETFVPNNGQNNVEVESAIESIVRKILEDENLISDSEAPPAGDAEEADESRETPPSKPPEEK